jgi:hypothetical protein
VPLVLDLSTEENGVIASVFRKDVIRPIERLSCEILGRFSSIAGANHLSKASHVRS